MFFHFYCKLFINFFKILYCKIRYLIGNNSKIFDIVEISKKRPRNICRVQTDLKKPGKWFLFEKSQREFGKARRKMFLCTKLGKSHGKTVTLCTLFSLFMNNFKLLKRIFTTLILMFLFFQIIYKVRNNHTYEQKERLLR